MKPQLKNYKQQYCLLYCSITGNGDKRLQRYCQHKERGYGFIAYTILTKTVVVVFHGKVLKLSANIAVEPKWAPGFFSLSFLSNKNLVLPLDKEMTSFH